MRWLQAILTKFFAGNPYQLVGGQSLPSSSVPLNGAVMRCGDG
jgi:hypothetical protein